MADLRSRLAAWLGTHVGQLFRASTLTLGAAVLNLAIVTVTMLILARHMPLAEFGTYGFAQSLVFMLMTVCTLGLPLTASRVVPDALASGRHGRISAFLSGGLLVCATLPVVVGVAVAAAVHEALPGMSAFPTLGTFALATAVTGVHKLLVDVLRAMGQAVLAAFVEAPIQRLLWLGMLGVAMARGEQISADDALLAFAASTVIMIAVVAALVLARLRRLAGARRIRPTVAELREWTAASLRMLPAPLFYLAVAETDIVLLGIFASPEVVGLYNVARRISDLLRFFYQAAVTVCLPRFAYWHARGDRRELQKTVTLVAVLSVPPALAGLAGVVLLGEWVLGLFGPAFVAAYGLLVLHAAIRVIDTVLGPVSEVLLMAGHHARTTAVNLAFVVFNLAVNAALIPVAGAYGAVVATGLSMIGWKGTLYVILRRVRAPETSLLVLTARRVRRRPRFGARADFA